MISIQPLTEEDATYVVEWNKGMTADFLDQWAGPESYDFPITEPQIISRIDQEPSSDYRLYKILNDNIVIGIIELLGINEQEKKAKVGRFLINPSLVGKGYGTAALKALTHKGFDEFGFHSLELNVFDFNKSAIRCYEKVGYKAVAENVYSNGWTAINMVISNPSL